MNNQSQPNTKLNNSLLLAVTTENINLVKSLVSEGADVNYLDYKGSIIENAFRTNNLTLIEFLLDNGVKKYYGDSYSFINEDLFYKAASLNKESLDIIKLLVKKEVFLHIYEDEQNALTLSAEKGYLNIVKFFIINCKKNVDFVINHDRTTEEVKEWAVSYKNSNNLNDKLQKKLSVKNETEIKKIKI